MLECAGLVRRRVRGREHILSFNAQPFDEAAAWMESQRTVWIHRLRALDALLQQEDREQRSRKAKKGGS